MTTRSTGLAIATRLLASALALGAASSAAAQNGPPPANVRLDAARMENVEQLRRVTGELRAVRRAIISAEEDGRVTSLTVEPGDAVSAGQVIAEQDARLLALDVARLEAAQSAARARLTEAESEVTQETKDVARLESAVGRGGVANSEVEDARIALASAEARAATALANLETASALLDYTRERLGKMTVRAPFDGSIIRKSAELGEWLGQGDPIIEVVALDEIDAWLDVPETMLDAFATGASIDVMVDALGQTAASADVSIIDSGDTLAHTFPVRVRLVNPGNRFRPGMAVTSMIPTGLGTQSLTVHKDAILRDDAGTFVYLNLGGQAIPARVERLWAVGDRVVIRSPQVFPGAEVVVEGNERLFPTQPLNDIDNPTPPPAAGG